MGNNIYQKINDARQYIKDSKLKKAGKNKFSNYEYFTPEQIDKLVFDACLDNGLITIFSLTRNEYGLEGVLQVADVDNPKDFVLFKQATDIPSIKATNIAQQMGGMVTYTERYLSMSAFNIKDNSLDFDTTENTKKNVSVNRDKPSLPKEKVDDAVAWALKNNKTIKDLDELYLMSKEVKELLETKMK